LEPPAIVAQQIVQEHDYALGGEQASVNNPAAPSWRCMHEGCGHFTDTEEQLGAHRQNEHELAS